MTSHANLAHPLEWLSGRSGPAGNAVPAPWEYTNDLSGILWLFFLEGAHNTLRGSSPGRFRTPQKCRVLGTRPPLTSLGKALSAVNVASGGEYKSTRSVFCNLGASCGYSATER